MKRFFIILPCIAIAVMFYAGCSTSSRPGLYSPFDVVVSAGYWYYLIRGGIWVIKRLQ